MFTRWVFVLLFLGLEVGCASQQMRSQHLPDLKLETVHFAFGKWNILEHEKKILEENADRLKRNGDKLNKFSRVMVVLEGHTDSSGPEWYNLYLGDRRARSVRSYLQTLGVDPRRLIIMSKGEKEPVSSNATPEGRAKNRRVEFDQRK